MRLGSPNPVCQLLMGLLLAGLLLAGPSRAEGAPAVAQATGATDDDAVRRALGLGPRSLADGPAVVEDRIVAVVDHDPIYASDVLQQLALASPSGASDERASASAAARVRRTLDGLIDQRLRLHEVDRGGRVVVAEAAIEAQLAQVRARFADDAAFDRALADAGLDRAALRVRLHRQLRVLRYVDTRLGPRVFIDRAAVRAAYDGPFRAEREARGETVPPFDAVREALGALLRAQALNDEIAAWTETLRARAQIIDRLASLPDAAPARRRLRIDGDDGDRLPESPH
ncbi:MAG: hypothetical protein AAF772_07600 [Acidobacteriota bacterium]